MDSCWTLARDTGGAAMTVPTLALHPLVDTNEGSNAWWSLGAAQGTRGRALDPHRRGGMICAPRRDRPLVACRGRPRSRSGRSQPGPAGRSVPRCGVDRDDRRRLPLKANTLTAWRDTRVVEPRGGRACAARTLVITDVMPLRAALAISGTGPDPAISGVALQAAIFAAARLFGDSCCSPWAGRCFRASRSSARHPWVRRGSEGPQFPHAESGRPMCRGRVRGLARAAWRTGDASGRHA